MNTVGACMQIHEILYKSLLSNDCDILQGKREI